jgi:5-methylcytosine-specific restriction endonuclease McrA
MTKILRYVRISDFENEYDKEGRKLCLNCKKPITSKRRTRYCSDECADEFSSRFMNQSTFKDLIIEKRGKKCEKCGKKVEHSWDLIFDHIEPIALGGKIFDEKNVQLLCKDCNRIKTRNDFRRIAEFRKQIKDNAVKEELLKQRLKMQKYWENSVKN